MIYLYFSQDTQPSSQAKIAAQFFNLPLYFESNKGQTDTQVAYLIRGKGYTFYFASQEMVMAMQNKDFYSVLKFHFLGASSTPLIKGLEEQESKSHYFLGNDPKQWHTNIPHYAKIYYQDLYPGLDAIFYGNPQQLEYDLCMKPGFNPQHIRLHIDGAKDLTINENGHLCLHLEHEQKVYMQRPFIYQTIEDHLVSIEGNYVLLAQNEVGFALGAYDTEQTLVIDPVLSYSTYLGGIGMDDARGITLDSSGNAYITGQTTSSNFPTTAGAFQTTYMDSTGSYDAFITKLNPTGTALVYSTYLGGSNSDFGFGITVDSSGNAYVTGQTASSDFPTTGGAFQTTFNGFGTAFITKLNPTGSTLVYSTYLGGSNFDAGFAIAIDESDNAYVTGRATSSDFPTTTGAFQTTLNGSSNAFITKLNPAGSALIYSTYVGDSNDTGYAIAVDSSDNAYITGITYSSNLPTTTGAFQTTLAGISNAFITKLNPAGSALVYSTYLGGSNQDNGLAIAIDSNGNAYVTGQAASPNFPTTMGAFQTSLPNIYANAFITKLNPTGSALVYSTYLGGTGTIGVGGDNGTGIKVDSFGNAYVTGFTQSSNFPITANAFQTTLNGSINAFITKLNAAGSALVYSSYLGGSTADTAQALAIDPNGSAYITGNTSSNDFPTTSSAFQTTLLGASNAFITKFDIGTPTVTNVNPNSGPTSGGTGVIISGTNFTNATNVFFGLNSATFIIDSDTQITATSPAGTGIVDVTVVAPGGTSPITAGDLFTYIDPTTTTLNVSPNPAFFGQTVTLTATVSPSAATGTVTFFDGATNLGTVSLAGGIASLATSSLAIGTHSLTAVYSGDSDYLSSTSNPVSLTVNPSPTTTSLTVSPNPAFFGQTVTLTAAVSPSTVTGTVSFFDGATNLGTVSLAGGIASLATSSLATGPHSLTAVYSGDSNYLSSTSAPVSLTVNPSPTITSLTVSPNPAFFGQSVTLTAAVSPSAVTGTVSFFDGVTNLGTVPLAGGTASLATSSLAIGTHSLTAVYSGDSDYLSSTSNPVSLTVNPSPTTTSLTVSPSPAFFGQTVTLTAAVSPSAATGTVTFFDGATNLGTVPLAGGAAALATSSLATGPHSLTAVYSGDSDYLSSTSAPVSLTVNPDPTTTNLTVSPNPAFFGQSVTLTAAVSPSAVTGTVTFFDGTTNLGTVSLAGGTASLATSSLAIGTHSLTAVYSGDSDYLSSTSAPVSLTVNPSPTITSLTVSPNPAFFGQTVTLTATVSPSAATGALTFFDGATNLGTVPLTGGAAALATSSLAVGPHSLTAVYSGDSDYLSSTSAPVSLTVNPDPTTTNLTVSPNPAFFGQTVTLTAAVSPSAATGILTFFDGVTNLGTVPLAGGTATLATSSLTIGTHSLTAVYSGDSNYLSSTSTPVSLTVNPNPTTTSLTVSPNPAFFGQSVTLTAAVSPSAATGTVIFFDGATNLGTVPLVGGTASLATSSLATGTHSLTAVYNGDSDYFSSTSNPVSLTVNLNPTITNLTVSPNPAFFGQTVTLTAAVSPSAATGTVSFFDGATNLGTVPLTGGAAALATSSLATGTHSLTTVYSGDSDYLSSTSAPVSLTVNPNPTTTNLTVSPNPAFFGQTVALTAAMSSSAATGTVTFFDGTTNLGTVPLINGVAVLEVSSLLPGVHALSAVYNGDANHPSVISPTIYLTITFPIPPQPSILPPTHLKSLQVANRFATQTEYVNILTWQAPMQGDLVVEYRIYRDSQLKNLVGIVSSMQDLRFEDHNRKKDKTYTYFVVSVDQFGNISLPATVVIKGESS